MTTFHATSGFASSQQDLLLASDIRFQSSLFHNAQVEDETKEDGFGDENININTSAEDDEDDGTSDRELASMDKEEDDEGNNGRSLASKACTFTSSGSNFMEQHWYLCYTYNLTVSEGCCSVCARVCHRGQQC